MRLDVKHKAIFRDVGVHMDTQRDLGSVGTHVLISILLHPCTHCWSPLEGSLKDDSSHTGVWGKG